jgi:hypothetical protein
MSEYASCIGAVITIDPDDIQRAYGLLLDPTAEPSREALADALLVHGFGADVVGDEGFGSLDLYWVGEEFGAEDESFLSGPFAEIAASGSIIAFAFENGDILRFSYEGDGAVIIDALSVYDEQGVGWRRLQPHRDLRAAMLEMM